MGTRTVRSISTYPHCTPYIHTNSGAMVGNVTLNKLRVGCLNVHGYKSNNDYIRKILQNFDIFGISEHRLHQYDLSLLQNAHADFDSFSRGQAHLCP